MGRDVLPKESFNGKDPIKKAQPFRRPRGFLLVAGLIVLLAVLTLALGLGLGLGLKNRNNGADTSASPSSSSLSSSTRAQSPAPSATSSSAPAGPQPWQLDTLEYNLDMNFNINAAPTTRMYNLTLTEIQAAPDGVVRTVLVINGQFPGPLIRVNRGDRLLVNVTNRLTNATAMHWHGMFQNGTNWMDGTTGITQCPIQPGHSFLYNFTIENQYGTYWYHSHYSTQYADGIVGPLIVHAPEEVEARQSYDYDQIILLQDWYHDLSSALLPGYLTSGNENAEPVPDNGLIQGTNLFDCSQYNSDSGYTCQDNSTQAAFVLEHNKRYRLRLINTGAFTEFQVSVDNHTLSVVEVDGTVVNPMPINRVAIHVAQRYSVILNANQSVSTNYWMRAQMNTYCYSSDNPVLNPDVRALVTYTNTSTAPTNSADWATALDLVCEDLNATTLVPTVISQPPPATKVFVVDVSFQIGAYALDKAYFNSTTWARLSNTTTLNLGTAGLHSHDPTFSTTGVSSAYGSDQFVIASSSNSSQVVDLLVISLDEGAHPFHLHGHVFWIMKSGEGVFDWAGYESGEMLKDVTNPLRRDTITLDAYGWSLIRFRADNPGMWAFHCHIVWHMEAGLLLQFQERSDIMSSWTIPEDVLGLCTN